MRAEEFLSEIDTSLGRKYQELYAQHYKQAHRKARQQGMDAKAANAYADKSLEQYKEKIRTGEWDPITRTKGLGRAIYKVGESELDEVEELDSVSKSKRQGYMGPRNINVLQRQLGVNQLLNLKNFSIWSSSNGVQSIYYVVDDRTQEAQIQLRCEEKNNVLSYLDLFAAPNNTIKAADFYRILITKLNKVLVADRQSPGSQAVWAKLNTFPDVSIHGWLNGKPVNITAADREYAYAEPPENWLAGFNKTGRPRYARRSKELDDAYKMKLVAHKK